MDFNKIFQSKKFKIALVAIAEMIILLLVFKAGEFVGYRKAHFSYRWAENYHRNFGGPRGGFFRDFGGDEYIDAHGTFGEIMKIDGNVLLIKGRDNKEKTMLVSDQTVIRAGVETIRPTDLKANDRVVIIGSPNEQGQIEAKLIRLFRN